MLFSSIGFLYYFLPIVIVAYFAVPKQFKNVILLLSSLFFYFYGEPIYCVIMLFSSLSSYLHGLWIDKAKKTRFSKIPLISSIVISLGVLGFFKYTDFFITNSNSLIHTNISLLKLALPIGISFYTFQTLSYTIDVYRGNCKVQKSLIDFTTYVSLFPQLIAGPIVRYSVVEAELSKRTHSFENFAYGVNRFIIGLSKKVLIANVLGEFLNAFAYSNDKTVLIYWICTFAFMLQVYFDFSGYSDMAIGLGRIFGFYFQENFNYPFVSKSITEFWRRWHISLGTWFRDYVYIPLGGNRVSKLKWVFNVFLVWLLTGFWHGAEWNFIIWGLYFGVFLVFEKLCLSKILDNAPRILRHLYLLFFITISFVIFRSSNMNDIVINFKGMFGALGDPLINHETLYYVKSYAVVFIIGIIGATPLTTTVIRKLRKNKKCGRILNVIEPILHISLLLLVTAYLIDGSFNPFLYFRF